MLRTRAPLAPLRPFVKTLWASDGIADAASSGWRRERVLPTGSMHLVFRLSEHPLRVYGGSDDLEGREIGLAIVGGSRSSYYLRDVSQPVRSVGAAFHPGAAGLLLGVPADELAERHTPLDELWGRVAADLRERLAEAGPIERQLDAFEALLAARLPRVRGLHPAVAGALQRLGAGAGLRTAVEESGYSRRRFIELFRSAVGLSPKRYCRVIRFQSALARVAARRAASWVDVALAAGYSDQPHFNRDFREFSGISPGRYRELGPRSPQHVPIPEAGRSISSKTRCSGAARLEASHSPGDRP